MLGMSNKIRVHPSELREFSRLATDAVGGLTDLVEAMHHNIARVPGISSASTQGRTRGITGLVYRSIRSMTVLVGQGIDAMLAQLVPLFSEGNSWPGRDPVLAALNGVLGDYLLSQESPLAIDMRLRRDGQPLELDKQALTAAIPRPTGKVLLLVHGLAMSDLQWNSKGHDHGAALALDRGYTPVYLHYNSGRHISANGREFADLIEALLPRWPVPVEELVIIAHSMGGLVSRSACHYGEAAGHGWLQRLHALLFLGTPHHGAPLERGGNWVNAIMGISSYSSPLTRLGMIRSAGITDLRYGNLLDEDWQGRDRFELSGDPRRSVPLPEGVWCYTIAATTEIQDDIQQSKLPGDGLVPMDSALGLHQDPSMKLMFSESRRWVGYGMNHMDLLNRPEVYQQIRRWLEP